jgi:Ice-binding-like
MDYREKYLTSGFLRLTARLAVMVMFAALFYGPSPALAGSDSFLGSAESFAVLAGGAVTCTNSSVTGDVGAGTVVTQTSCTVAGTVHQGDTAAATAYADFVDAYATLKSTPCNQTLTGTLAGVTLTPGVYCFDAAATLTGTLTLNGPVDGIWLFKIGTLGTGALTGTNFSVVMAGGGQACNVNWWAAQAATMTTSHFQGTILAGADITVTGGTFNGDALAGGAGSTAAPTGAVTLTGAILAGCAATATEPPQCREPKHKKHCNQGVGNGPEDCDPGNSNQGDPSRSNDELGGTPGDPGRKGGNGK